MEHSLAIPDDLDSMLGERDIVRVEGPDAVDYLNSQVSQQLSDLDVGARRWTFVLAPNGRVEALARVTRADEQRYDFDTDAGYGEALLERLNRFRIRVDCDTSLVSAGSQDVDPDAEAARVRIGWPKLGAEIIPGETIPGGTGLTKVAVNFKKGCYPGQELVERMDSRAAEAPKSLRRLTIEAAQPGDDILDGDDVVGTITSATDDAAIGWVKRSSERGVVIQFES